MNWKIIALLALLALVSVAHATRESEEVEVEDSHEVAAVETSDMSAEEMLEAELEAPKKKGKTAKSKGKKTTKKAGAAKITKPAAAKKPAAKVTKPAAKVTKPAAKGKKPTAKKNTMTVNGKTVTLKKVTVKPTLPKPRPTQFKLEAHQVPTKKPLTKKEKKAKAKKEPVYLGCYKDGKVRAVPHRRGKVGGFFKTGSVKSTMHQCQAMAQKHGDVFFALQNGNQCWSGKAAETNYAMYGIETDAKKCEDKDGGPYTNKVYSINF